MTRFKLSSITASGPALLQGMKTPLILAVIAMLGIGQAMAQQAPNGNQTKTQDQIDQMHLGNGSLSGN
jgi:hypothetical protein